MDPVSRLFPGAGNRRTTRVGLEHELLTRDAATGAPVADRAGASRHLGRRTRTLTFEPGGQVELSLPCGPDRPSAAGSGCTVSALRGDLRARRHRARRLPRRPPAAGRRAAPADLGALRRHGGALRHRRPGRPPDDALHRLHPGLPRLVAGRAGLEQWRLLQLAGPSLAARFARSGGPGSRLATWLAVDPGRTAFDDRLLHGDDPVAAYADFARGATPFTGPDEHLSTLFPPVRPRGRYLEVRFLDVQPQQRIPEVIVALTRLMYDDEVRRQAADRARARRAEVGRALARGGDGRPRDQRGTSGCMRTLFVTDPLPGLCADIDASVGLMDACQAEGAEVWVCEPADLGVVGGRLVARARRISLRPRHRGTQPPVGGRGGVVRRGRAGPRSTSRRPARSCGCGSTRR